MTYSPASLVRLVDSTLVATFVATTVAPARTAPPVSVIVPWIDPPPPVCANAQGGANKVKTPNNNNPRNVLADFPDITDLHFVCPPVSFQKRRSDWQKATMAKFLRRRREPASGAYDHTNNVWTRKFFTSMKRFSRW